MLVPEMERLGAMLLATTPAKPEVECDCKFRLALLPLQKLLITDGNPDLSCHLLGGLLPDAPAAARLPRRALLFQLPKADLPQGPVF